MAQRETCGQRKSVKKYLRAEPLRYLGPTPLFKTEATARNAAASPSSLLDTVFYSAHSEQCSVCPSDSDSACPVMRAGRLFAIAYRRVPYVSYGPNDSASSILPA